MNKLCKIHPNMEQFLRENMYGINMLEELAEQACEIYSKLKSLRPEEPGFTDKVAESDVKDYLSTRALDALIKNPTTVWIKECSRCGKKSKVHIFGYLKLGERANGDLEEDAKNYYVKDEANNAFYFDLDRCINVGPKVKPLHDGAAAIFGDSNMMVFDIDALLVRALGCSNSLLNTEEVRKSILATMVSKLCIVLSSVREMDYMIDNMFKLYDGECKCRENRYNLKYILATVFIYRMWYNAANGINDTDVEKSVENIMELVELAARSFNVTQAIPDVYNMIHSKIMSKVMDVPRYPDRVVTKSIYYYRNAMNYYSFRDDNGRRHHATNIKDKKVLGVESLSAEAYLSNLTRLNFRDKKRASLAMIGFENIQSNMKDYDEFKRKSRAMILASLNNEERLAYLRMESDVLKLRAEAIGCRSEFSKGTILKRGATLGRLIAMELGRNNRSENFVQLMAMLDGERVTVASELANRDIYKERNTMLNGTIATKHEWDY